MWVYLKSEPSLWTVGFYSPNGKWHAESDHESEEAAASRTHWLNGGWVPRPESGDEKLLKRLFPREKTGG